MPTIETCFSDLISFGKILLISDDLWIPIFKILCEYYIYIVKIVILILIYININIRLENYLYLNILKIVKFLIIFIFF